LKHYLKKEAGGSRPLILLHSAEEEKKELEKILVSVEQTLAISVIQLFFYYYVS
jgi:hypothetical protein